MCHLLYLARGTSKGMQENGGILHVQGIWLRI